jgi:hypothetical protein
VVQNRAWMCAWFCPAAAASPFWPLVF